VRPVNLIPPEDRRGDSAPLRTGALVYLVVGACVAVLLGVTALVLAGNTITEREAEVTRLEREDAQATAEAQRLAPYVQFRLLSEQRVQTVASLADSRFDWERVMRELALILPGDVWLVKLEGSAAPGAGGDQGGGGDLRASAPGPALQLAGCAKGQEGVAAFVTALKDIDGVTRVGVESSELPDERNAAGAAEGSDDDCRTRSFIAKFEIVIAFDAAPVAAAESLEAAPPPEEAEDEDEGAEE
jgi:Tfp pilus assembly protein PilN